MPLSDLAAAPADRTVPEAAKTAAAITIEVFVRIVVTIREESLRIHYFFLFGIEFDIDNDVNCESQRCLEVFSLKDPI